ncbi:membrane protein [Corynebacterium sphenisci DSM 44792]|uniref:Membrane protein n=1 Tax=Corynebacterium sphenisci DSM 44792 TaxID=1437874 RepID=A0A1L7CXV2_9CORY|nr:membrane protein [Corynebacterium sphenisci DSM 44792]
MVTENDSAPQAFRDAVASMHDVRLRPEISLGEIRPPRRLAPFSHAVGLEVVRPEPEVIPETSGDDAFGRLILLHDPRTEETWEGTMRLVAYIQADMDPDVAGDPLLPQVAWQWLLEGLAEAGAGYSNLGGTVTSTNSVRHGDISGPPQAFQLELRSSWTAVEEDLGPHVEAFAHVLAHVAGLPPEGVTRLGG